MSSRRPGKKVMYIGVGMCASIGLAVGAGIGAALSVGTHISAVLGLIFGAILDAQMTRKSWKET